jgi:hypothetical protein
MALKGNFIPLANFLRIQVVYDGQSIELVEAGSYLLILDIRQTAQMNYEIGTPALASQLIACALYISIGQAQTLSGSTKPRARLQVGSREFSRLAQSS